MGTDVHAVWQAKKDGKWVDIESTWDQDRHYFLFAWLADVRNGYGFAGIPTHDAIKPIAPRRGLPEDFTVVDGEDHPVACIEAIDPRRREWLDEDEKGNPVAWLGDHSHSWLTADEILAAERPGAVRKDGVLTLEQYHAWDKESQPEAWCGGVMGPNLVTSMPSEIGPGTTHVQVSWIRQDDGLDYFVNEVKRLKDLHGEVRLVFGFDS
jgi:hypothetical protein